MKYSKWDKIEQEKMKTNEICTHIIYKRENKHNPEGNKMQIMLVRMQSDEKHELSVLANSCELKLLETIKGESYGFNREYKAIEGFDGKNTELDLDYEVDWTMPTGLYTINLKENDFVRISECQVHIYGGYDFIKTSEGIFLETSTSDKYWEFTIFDKNGIIYNGCPTSDDGKIKLETSERKLKLIVEKTRQIIKRGSEIGD